MNRTQALPRPDEQGQLVLEEGPLAVEIGFGNGEFIAWLAPQHPDVTYYGIEVSLTSVDRAYQRCVKACVENVRFLLGDARFLLRRCFPADRLERIYMHFPCPWPKKRHARRRVTAKGFADTLASRLKVGGEFEFATDEGWYADEVAEGLSAHPALELVRREPYRRPITTKYERRWIDEGKERTLLVFRKTVPFALEESKKEEQGIMHLHCKGATPAPDRLRPFVEGRQGGSADAHWAFRGLFGDGDVSLVETVTSDEGYEQKFYLKVVCRDDGPLVKLDGVSHPYLTDGVRAALAALAELVQEAGK